MNLIKMLRTFFYVEKPNVSKTHDLMVNDNFRNADS